MIRPILTTAAVAAAMIATPAIALASDFIATFSGFNETPAILSEGRAHLSLRLDRAGQTLAYTLTFSNLTAVTQSHIHFGKPHTAGAVIVFFCSNLASKPAGVQACPDSSGTVAGVITAANVLPIAAQHITAGDFDALEDALDSHTAYGNIHTVAFPGGEIRGEIHSGDGE